MTPSQKYSGVGSQKFQAYSLLVKHWVNWPERACGHVDPSARPLGDTLVLFQPKKNNFSTLQEHKILTIKQYYQSEKFEIITFQYVLYWPFLAMGASKPKHF